MQAAEVDPKARALRSQVLLLAVTEQVLLELEEAETVDVTMLALLRELAARLHATLGKPVD